MVSETAFPALAIAICLFATIGRVSLAAEAMDVGFELASSLPREFLTFLQAESGLDEYELLAKPNPFYVQGDFNGDDRTDTAIFLEEKSTGKVGVLIFHAASGEHFVLAAGTEFGDRGDDFSRFDAWHVVPRAEVPQGADETAAPPLLVGDALYLEVLESGSGIVYWNGNDYVWYQQGD